MKIHDEQRLRLAHLLATGYDLETAIIKAGIATTKAQLRSEVWEGVLHLTTNPEFIKQVNTLTATNIQTMGMGMAWKAVQSVLRDPKGSPSSKISAANFVRDTLKDMSDGSLSANYDRMEGATPEDIDVMIENAKKKRRAIKNAKG